MSCKVIEPPCFFHLSSNHNQSIPHPLHLSFNTHFPKHTISIKTSSRTTTKAAINSLYAATHTKETFYDLLGVPESGTLPEIKRAYKQLARKYHPDVSPPERKDEYTRSFIRVQEAYETLSDPQTRALYDVDMSKGLVWKQRSGERDDWMNLWESQLTVLKRRSVNRSSMSWGSRIRRQRSEAFVH